MFGVFSLDALYGVLVHVHLPMSFLFYLNSLSGAKKKKKNRDHSMLSDAHGLKNIMCFSRFRFHSRGMSFIQKSHHAACSCVFAIVL